MIAYLLSVWAVLLGVVAVSLLKVIYNLYFHPLAKIPGPRLWAASGIPFSLAIYNGTIVRCTYKLHTQYGPIVRVAPKEVIFATPDAYPDLFSPRANQKTFLRNPTWWAPPPGVAESIVSVINSNKHRWMRRLLSPSLTLRAVRAQEPFIQKYVNLLVDRLLDLVRKERSEATELDMTPWVNYITFDVFGEFGFGEPFNCLQNSSMTKFSSFLVLMRYYPLIGWLIGKCIPSPVRNVAADYQQQNVDKCKRRLGWEIQHPDMMAALVDQDGELLMPIEEVYETFAILTIAGSETTATALSATIGYLVNKPDSLKQLEAEVRGTFASLDDITLETVKVLPYLDAVLHESLRLCPPIPWIVPRIVPEGGDTVCGLWLPTGTSVSLQAYALNRDPALFHESTSFVPERWLESTRADSTSPFFHDKHSAAQPFGTGPWSCIGVHLAWAELRLIIAKLAWNFDFSAIEDRGGPWDDLRGWILVERKPVNVRVALRETR